MLNYSNIFRFYYTKREKKFFRMCDCFIFLFSRYFLGQIDFIKITWIELLASGKHVVDSGEYHPCDSDNGSFLASSFGKTFILDSIVRRLIRFHGCMGNLYQCRFEVDTSTCYSNRFLLTSRLVVARR